MCENILPFGKTAKPKGVEQLGKHFSQNDKK